MITKDSQRTKITQMNTNECVIKFLNTCVHLWKLFNNSRSFALFADKYSLCGRGLILDLHTVFGQETR